MKKSIKTTVVALTISSALLVASAQNVIFTGSGQGANWVGTPTLQTGSPGTFTIGENNYTASPSVLPMLGQTFTATISGTLSDIQILASGAGGNNYVYLWDLGAASSYAAVSGASMPSSLSTLPGYSSFSYANLFSDGSYFNWGGSGNIFVRTLTFPGQTISLTAGDLYYFGIAPNLTSAVITWQRVSTDPYSGGAAYREGGVINGTPGIRDFGMAVDITPIPEPSTLALISLVGGAALLGWRQKRQS
jgi:hypothetical protein